MPTSVHPVLPSRCWRAVALLSAGTVWLLSLASVSPQLHSWLHAAAQAEHHGCPHHGRPAADLPQAGGVDQPAGDHECAVTLFSRGVIEHAAAMVAGPCESILRAVDLRAGERPALVPPRFLHLPPQAPPAV